MVRSSRALLIGGALTLALAVTLFEWETAPAADFRPIFPNRALVVPPPLNGVQPSVPFTPATPNGAYGFAAGNLQSAFTGGTNNIAGNTGVGGGAVGIGVAIGGGGNVGIGVAIGGGGIGGIGGGIGGIGGGNIGGIGGFGAIGGGNIGGGNIGGFGAKGVGFNGCTGQ